MNFDALKYPCRHCGKDASTNIVTVMAESPFDCQHCGRELFPVFILDGNRFSYAFLTDEAKKEYGRLSECGIPVDFSVMEGC